MQPIEVEQYESDNEQNPIEQNNSTGQLGTNFNSSNNHKRYWLASSIHNGAGVYVGVVFGAVLVFFIALKAIGGGAEGGGGGGSAVTVADTATGGENDLFNNEILSSSSSSPISLQPLDHFSQAYKGSEFFRQVICNENENGASSTSLSLEFQCCDIVTTEGKSSGKKDSVIVVEPRRGTTGPKRTITLAIYLNGQMGNVLSYVARSYGVKRSMEIKSHQSLNIQLVGIHKKDNSDWLDVRQQLQTCFPQFFSSFNFDSGKWDTTGEFQARLAQLREWEVQLNLSTHDPLNIDPYDCHHYDPNCWHATYCQLQRMLRLQEQQKLESTIGSGSGSGNDNDVFDIQEPPNATISMPFLTATNLPYMEAVDAYYDEIKNKIYRFNPNMNDYCCDPTTEVPARDEIVFHVRDFGVQMLEHGFHEMEPEQVATELFKDYKHGTRIAIVSHSKDVSIQYEDALTSKGYIVRHINHGNNSLHDFCFITQAVREVVGMKMSTFVTWAGMLSNAKLVRLYVMDSEITQKFHNAQHLLSHHPFQNKELQKRIRLETYQYKKQQP